VESCSRKSVKKWERTSQKEGKKGLGLQQTSCQHLQAISGWIKKAQTKSKIVSFKIEKIIGGVLWKGGLT